MSSRDRKIVLLAFLVLRLWSKSTLLDSVLPFLLPHTLRIPAIVFYTAGQCIYAHRPFLYISSPLLFSLFSAWGIFPYPSHTKRNFALVKSFLNTQPCVSRAFRLPLAICELLFLHGCYYVALIQSMSVSIGRQVLQDQGLFCLTPHLV